MEGNLIERENECLKNKRKMKGEKKGMEELMIQRKSES